MNGNKWKDVFFRKGISFSMHGLFIWPAGLGFMMEAVRTSEEMRLREAEESGEIAGNKNHSYSKQETVSA